MELKRILSATCSYLIMKENKQCEENGILGQL